MAEAPISKRWLYQMAAEGVPNWAALEAWNEAEDSDTVGQIRARSGHRRARTACRGRGLRAEDAMRDDNGLRRREVTKCACCDGLVDAANPTVSVESCGKCGLYFESWRAPFHQMNHEVSGE